MVIIATVIVVVSIAMVSSSKYTMVMVVVSIAMVIIAIVRTAPRSRTVTASITYGCRQRLPHGPDGRPLPLYALVAGAVAGTLAHVLTHPLDTVRRRMQTPAP